jgi:hypothetical protein
MAALFEPDAALACGGGRIAVGTAAIRKFYIDLLAAGRTFDLGEHAVSIHSRRANGELDGQLRTGVLPKKQTLRQNENNHNEILGLRPDNVGICIGTCGNCGQDVGP